MKKARITAILFLILVSCSPTAKLRRAEKLIAKAKAGGAHVKSDTVFSIKEVITKEVKKDTVFKDVAGDTVYITKDNITEMQINLKEMQVQIFQL